MALRFISSEATREDFERVLTEVRESGDEVVLEVGGRAVAMVIPITDWARGEALREAFGAFWDKHKADQLENPPDLSEDEAMELALDAVRQARRELRAEREATEGIRAGASGSDAA